MEKVSNGLAAAPGRRERWSALEKDAVKEDRIINGECTKKEQLESNLKVGKSYSERERYSSVNDVPTVTETSHAPDNSLLPHAMRCIRDQGGVRPRSYKRLLHEENSKLWRIVPIHMASYQGVGRKRSSSSQAEVIRAR